ncbi:MAG TPA: AglZ/HisF2 family acetamidino modification protein [Puia sp.]|jgi:cyclase|nr:AglZ/HisF2 family acetamidino modification protein [Puia sp.]
MSQVRIIPVLLLKNGGLYKTVRFGKDNYVGDPINTVKIFNEKEADELVLLDYHATLDKRAPDFSKIAEIAGEAFMPMAYGGGITQLDQARKVFDGGFEKVVLNSVLFNNLSILEEIGNIYGAQSVVASVDVKKNLFGKLKVYSVSGTRKTDLDPVEWAKNLEAAGAGEIFLNAVDRDGTWEGYDIPLLRAVSSAVKIPVIACGGAGSMADFEKAVREGGASAVAAGSMFVYQRKGMGVLVNFPAQKIKI